MADIKQQLVKDSIDSFNETFNTRCDNAYTVGKIKGLLRDLKASPNIGLTGRYAKIDEIIDELDNIQL